MQACHKEHGRGHIGSVTQSLREQQRGSLLPSLCVPGREAPCGSRANGQRGLSRCLRRRSPDHARSTARKAHSIPMSSPDRRRPARRTAGQGQWALGHLEPLNPNERTKKDDDGLNVRQRIETIYSKAGFASIDAADLRGRMRWWGLYTQHRPGIDRGRTAGLEPEELDDEYFMLRVRIPGGRLTNT